MKPTILTLGFALLLFLAFTACGNNKTANTDAENAAIETEIQQLDSLNNDLENTTQELESDLEALEEALEDL